MPSPISPSGPAVTPVPPSGVPIVSTPTPGAVASTPAATGIASLAVDGVDTTTGNLAVRRVRAAASPSVDASGIQSQFPLDDLSQISTDGRYAQGFRLDSGSLRLMWMTARRTTDADGTTGFEIFFQAHGAAVERYKKRLEQAGATAGSYQFHAAEPDESAGAGKATLKRDNQKWSPSSGGTISLTQAGKWSVDFVPTAPEAIKGAMRIRVQGNDADATKALNELIGKLGLQSAFAPPKPQALEKLKIMRLLWQISSGAADRLRFTPLQGLPGKAELATSADETDAGAAAAIAAADLTSAPILKRAQLAALLYTTSPRAFLAWAKGETASTNGILPAAVPSPDTKLESALATAGVPTHGEAYNAALATPLDAAEARAILQLGLLAKKAVSKAENLAGRDVEGVALSELHDLCAELGVSEERVANLRFDEVYPGYFTVVDPSLSDQLHAAGARYLYSTADSPERVWQMLTGGQKSSLTRFQEGLLIQGKSSARDFETGGATSVFSRLVTESVVSKAKSGASGTDTTFRDWSGSRPYKLIINRRALDRTDWYGFNGDNFGRTTALKPENHGEALIKTIGSAYNASNEICFPIGSDAAYVDLVACANEQQKTNLINFLAGKGITEWRGRPIADAIVVTTKFIEHPDDMTLPSAVRDALRAHGFKATLDGSAAVVKAAIEAKIAEVGPAAAQALAEEQLRTTGRTRLEQRLATLARTAGGAATTASSELVKALDVEGTKTKVASVAEAATREAARVKLEQVAGYSTNTIELAVKKQVGLSPQKATEDLVAELAAKWIADEPPPADKTPQTRAALREKLRAALEPEVRGLVIAKTNADGAGAAHAAAEALVESSGVNNALILARDAGRAAAGDAAVNATNATALSALIAAVDGAVRAKLEPEAKSQLAQSGAGWVTPGMAVPLEAQTIALATEVAAPAAVAHVLGEAKAQATALVDAAVAKFTLAMPEKVTPELVTQVPAIVEAELTALATAAATAQASKLATAQNRTLATTAANAAITALGPEITEAVIVSLAQTTARTAAEAPIRAAAQQVADGLYSEATKAVAAEVKTKVGAQLAKDALDRTSQSLGTTWAKWAVDNKLNAIVDAIMAKAPV